MSKELEEIVLKNLSFYEPMGIDKLILDISDEDLDKYPDFNLEKLEEILKTLKKKKLVKLVTKKPDRQWIRISKKRPWWKIF